jgi:hypothetical protein
MCMPQILDVIFEFNYWYLLLKGSYVAWNTLNVKWSVHEEIYFNYLYELKVKLCLYVIENHAMKIYVEV